MNGQDNIEIFINNNIDPSRWGIAMARALTEVKKPFRLTVVEGSAGLSNAAGQSENYQMYFSGSQDSCNNSVNFGTEGTQAGVLTFNCCEEFEAWVQNVPDFPPEMKQAIMAIPFGEDCEVDPQSDCVPGVLCLDPPQNDNDSNDGVIDPVEDSWDL